jgi:mannitol-1-phosphate/altronate dehydrogenase
MLGLRQVFPAGLAVDKGFVERIEMAYEAIQRGGARAALEKVMMEKEE